MLLVSFRERHAEVHVKTGKPIAGNLLLSIFIAIVMVGVVGSRTAPAHESCALSSVGCGSIATTGEPTLPERAPLAKSRTGASQPAKQSAPLPATKRSPQAAVTPSPTLLPLAPTTVSVRD